VKITRTKANGKPNSVPKMPVASKNIVGANFIVNASSKIDIL
jgi:hypothetical protein